MIDKSKELCTSINLINDKLHFMGAVEGNPPVSIDYTPPLGDNLGYTSLELLLLSLSSCIGSSLLVFLRRMRKNHYRFRNPCTWYKKGRTPYRIQKNHPGDSSKIFRHIGR